MAYVKTTWETGDVITAEKLNNMEGGIEAHDPLICIKNIETGALDHTWQEIHDKLAAGGQVILLYTDEYTAAHGLILAANNYTPGEYEVNCYVFSDSGVVQSQYTATSADGYPTLPPFPVPVTRITNIE